MICPSSYPITVYQVSINGYVLRNKINMRREHLFKGQRSSLARPRGTDQTTSEVIGDIDASDHGPITNSDTFNISKAEDEGRHSAKLDATQETAQDLSTMLWLGFFATVNFAARFFYRDYIADSLYVHTNKAGVNEDDL